MSERPTLQTIADAVGVSRATVSNAYNHPERLSEELRERILAAAGELSYAGPDPAARRLRRRQAGAVGLIFTETLSYAFADAAAVAFLSGLTRRCEEEGSGLLLLPLPRGGVDPALPVREAVVDAICIFSMPDGHPALEAALERRLPAVVVDEPRSVHAAFVGIDDRAGARALAEEVARLGHTDVGVVVPTLVLDGREGLVDDERLARASYELDRQRLGGFADADFPSMTIWECANRRDAGARAAKALLARDPAPSALLCTTDGLALGALDAAAELGLRVPEDVSVTGFDDVPEAARAGLATVRQPLEEKGHAAGDLLFELMAGSEPRELVLPVEPVLRASLGPSR